MGEKSPLLNQLRSALRHRWGAFENRLEEVPEWLGLLWLYGVVAATMGIATVIWYWPLGEVILGTGLLLVIYAVLERWQWAFEIFTIVVGVLAARTASNPNTVLIVTFCLVFLSVSIGSNRSRPRPEHDDSEGTPRSH